MITLSVNGEQLLTFTDPDLRDRLGRVFLPLENRSRHLPPDPPANLGS